MKEKHKYPILILVDIQKGFDMPGWGERNNPQAEENCEKLLDHWRSKKWPIVHIKHDSKDANSTLFPGQSGNEFKEAVSPQGDEQIIVKHVNSAFIGTSLEEYLRNRSIDAVVLVGLTTDHCISTTARMGANLGF